MALVRILDLGNMGELVGKQFMKAKGFTILKNFYPRKKPVRFYTNAGPNYTQVLEHWRVREEARKKILPQVLSLLSSEDKKLLNKIFSLGLEFDFMVYCKDDRLLTTHLALCEVKTNKGMLRKKQRERIIDARKAGIPVFLINVVIDEGSHGILSR